MEHVDGFGIVCEVVNDVRSDGLEGVGAVEAVDKCEGEVQWRRRKVGVEGEDGDRIACDAG